VGILQAVQIKGRAAFSVAVGVERPPVDPRCGLGKMGAGLEHLDPVGIIAHCPLSTGVSTIPPVPEPAPAHGPSPEIHGIRGWRRLALWPLALVVRGWCSTLRFEISGEDRRLLEGDDQPVVFVLWHNRLFISAEIYRRFRSRKLCGLVSASRDGAWLAAFFSLMGIDSVRGSSSRFGREAATRLAETLLAGGDVGITPDGPRGPRYEFKLGALVVARRARAPILLFGAQYDRPWRLRSWDRFCLPRPFSKVRVRCERVGFDLVEEREGAAAEIASRLAAINPD